MKGFGCMSLTSGFYGDNVDVTETEKTLRKALDLGVTLLNTADFYTSMTSGATYENIKLIGVCLLAFSALNINLAANPYVLYSLSVGHGQSCKSHDIKAVLSSGTKD